MTEPPPAAWVLANEILGVVREQAPHLWTEAAPHEGPVRIVVEDLVRLALREAAGQDVAEELLHVRAQALNWSWTSASALRGWLILAAQRLAAWAMTAAVDVAAVAVWAAVESALERGLREEGGRG